MVLVIEDYINGDCDDDDEDYTNGDCVQDAKAVYDVVGAVEKDKVGRTYYVKVSA